MAAGRLDLPRERQTGDGADGGVDPVAVETAAFAGRDGGAVAPDASGSLSRDLNLAVSGASEEDARVKFEEAVAKDAEIRARPDPATA
jgi:hypothetical protein